MSSAYSYRSTYSSATTPASSTNRTWLAYPSSYSSTTSIDLTADTHSGYLGKSQMTAATLSGGAAMTIDWVEVSVMVGRLPPPARRYAVGSPGTEDSPAADGLIIGVTPVTPRGKTNPAYSCDQIAGRFRLPIAATTRGSRRAGVLRAPGRDDQRFRDTDRPGVGQRREQ